ncbi:MAG: hypothetical protein M1818_004774 [Claussenomyces sp. TS43310]|nr:MAG: hypothetical protein M1818_004774 [Claussenomyces sp. TS43310]
MAAKSTSGYRAVKDMPNDIDCEDTESFLHQEPVHRCKEPRLNRLLFWSFCAVSVALLIAIGYTIRLDQASVNDRNCARQLSIAAPGLEAVEYEEVMFQGAQDQVNPYKGPPSPELDAAWDELIAGNQTQFYTEKGF